MTTPLDTAAIASDLADNFFDELKALGVNLKIDVPMNTKDMVVVNKDNFIVEVRPSSQGAMSYKGSPGKLGKPQATFIRTTLKDEDQPLFSTDAEKRMDNPIVETMKKEITAAKARAADPTPTRPFNQYVEDACRTESKPDDEMFARTAKSMRLLHSVMGMMTELGELVDPLKKYIFYDKEIDIVNMSEEIGDLLWYMAIMFDDLDLDMVQIMETNIEKLKQRYPDKYNHGDAEHRDLSREREELERRYREDE